MEKTLKTIFKYILIVICAPIYIPFALLGFFIFFILFLIPAPFEMLVYRKSIFHEESGIKYRLKIIQSKEYEIYNMLKVLGFSLSVGTKEKAIYLILHDAKDIDMIFYRCNELVYSPEEDMIYEISVRDDKIPFPDSLEKIYKEYGLSKSPNTRILMDQQDVELDEPTLEAISRYEDVVVYDGYNDLLNTLLDTNEFNFTYSDFDKYRPTRISRLFVVLIYIVLGIYTLPMFFKDAGIGLIITGSLLALAILTIIYIQIGKSRLFKIKELKIPIWIDNSMLYLSLFALVTMFVLWLS